MFNCDICVTKNCTECVDFRERIDEAELLFLREDTCPVCESKLTRQGKCRFCPECGFSVCDN